MRLADRIERLGSETAFTVSAEAAAFASEGNTVYPFHLGDINIMTPANIMDAAERAMREGKTRYCPNAGIPRLRELLAENVNRSHGINYTMENVSIQPGGKPVINKFLLALMNTGDEVLYPNPGFPIYESQIAFQGGKALPYGYVEGKETFTLDMDAIERQLTPRTKLLIFNDWQNPTSAECSLQELEKLSELAIKHDLYVLCDEAYYDVRYEGKSISLASLPGMAERCVILYTFSKKFAMTGWRLGAAIGPQDIIDVITRLNVNDESCTNHFVQYAAMEGLTGDQAPVRKMLDIFKARRDVAVDILNSIEGVRCFRPNVTFYLYPNITGAMKRKGFDDLEAFRKALLHETGVSVCTRLHFGHPLEGEKDCYLRLAYSGIDIEDIREGLGRFKAFVEG
ncbi:MAG TPA: aminotransferase class I/II-fold pyridoxal phosphate-dependent enzyme [Syntrophales bacterium]|nr:aminotransferase class I/II-fold pyridoxal phosphate-dependent enzyme [Syntrophales bacterium]HPQ44107.1 aminotransferase class I/II-fold pyridoxal phosphate-dependent enzyme [Syntrophales bacterium]